jgi:predicted dehydrogenase
MATVRLGVIGCGGITRAHLPSLGGKSEFISPELRPYAEQVELRAACDVDLERAGALKEEYGGAYVTDDPERVFTDPDVDAVLITTWHDTHAPFSLRAMACGKHVLIEKPMAMTLAECDAVLEAEATSGVKYMVAFRCRFARGANDVKREIPRPDNTIAFARINGIWPEGIWPQDPIKGGGQILSQGCHVVDMMFFLAGAEPESVWATGGVYHHERKPEPIDTINAAIRYRNGSVGAFIGGDGGQGRLLLPGSYTACPFFVMVVDKGRSGIAIDHGQNARFESSVPAEQWQPPYEERNYSADLGEGVASGMPDILPAFAKSIINNEPPPATAADGARTTRFVLKCFESAQTGKVIDL